jgi:transcriptional regulator with XRE-family HTH domain
MPDYEVTSRTFQDELPRLLGQRRLSQRALAREVGGFDHGYLSRMLRGDVSVNPEHAERIARHLGLPADYFPEVREARVIAAIRARGRLRDEIYFSRVRKRST